MCSIFWCFFLTFHNMSTYILYIYIYVYIFLFFSPQVPCNTFGQTKHRCQASASRIFMHSLAESCKLKKCFLWQCWSSQICSSESHSNRVVHTISFANAYEPTPLHEVGYRWLQQVNFFGVCSGWPGAVAQSAHHWEAAAREEHQSQAKLGTTSPKIAWIPVGFIGLPKILENSPLYPAWSWLRAISNWTTLNVRTLLT